MDSRTPIDAIPNQAEFLNPSIQRQSLRETYLLICNCAPVLDAGVGNLDGVAMVVCRRVFNLNEIATWFDRLTMSGYAPRNDRWEWASSQ